MYTKEETKIPVAVIDAARAEKWQSVREKRELTKAQLDMLIDETTKDLEVSFPRGLYDLGNNKVVCAECKISEDGHLVTATVYRQGLLVSIPDTVKKEKSGLVLFTL